MKYLILLVVIFLVAIFIYERKKTSADDRDDIKNTAIVAGSATGGVLGIVIVIGLIIGGVYLYRKYSKPKDVESYVILEKASE